MAYRYHVSLQFYFFGASCTKAELPRQILYMADIGFDLLRCKVSCKTSLTLS